MAGIAEAETQAAYAWALDDGDELELPTQRLTSRRITALSLAASLIVIAVAGGVALGVLAPGSRAVRAGGGNPSGGAQRHLPIRLQRHERHDHGCTEPAAGGGAKD